jgi:hypothetical protein
MIVSEEADEVADMDSTLDLRVSDAEREAVADQLRQHTADGRLTVEEFTSRLDEVYAAKTGRDLRAVLRELPPLVTPESRAPARRDLRRPPGVPAPVIPYLVFAFWMVVLWALTGAGYFWPIWPLLGWGIPLMIGLRGRRHGWGCAPRHRIVGPTTRL